MNNFEKRPILDLKVLLVRSYQDTNLCLMGYPLGVNPETLKPFFSEFKSNFTIFLMAFDLFWDIIVSILRFSPSGEQSGASPGFKTNYILYIYIF